MARTVCKTCRHYVAGHFGPSGTAGKESLCTLEIQGRTAPLPCSVARGTTGDCGPDGLFFDERAA